MLLSIVMMVKNEEKFLEKTLIALQPLMNEIESELIILDTGSEDSTVSIAKKFTKNVYFEKWNKDFANMRNKSISYAKGDWILIIDADEELTDYQKMIEFFDNNKYKKYNSATIRLKNLTSNHNKNNYELVSIHRMFKRTKDFKYIGKIHEQPIIKQPSYENIASFNHYGYNFEDTKFRNKKLARNEELLISQLKHDKNNPYINFQLGTNYLCYKKEREAIKYLEKSYEEYKKRNSTYEPVYLNLMKLYINLDIYDKCEKIGEEFLEKKEKHLDIYYYLALSKMKSGKLDESLGFYKKYIDLCNSKDYLNSTSFTISTYGLKKEVLSNMMRINYKLFNYYEVIDLYNNMCNERIDLDLYLIIVKSLKELNKLSELVDYYGKINDDIEQKKFEVSIEKILLDMEDDYKYEIIDSMCKIPNNYGKLNKLRLAGHIEIDEIVNILRNGKTDYYGDILRICIEKNIDIINVLYNIEENCIKKYLEYVISKDKEISDKLYEILYNGEITVDIRKIKVYKTISSVMIQQDNISDFKYKNIFLMHIMYVDWFIKLIYDKYFTYEELVGIVSSDDEKIILKLKIAESIKDKNPMEYISKIKTILNEYPLYNKGIKILIEEFEKQILISDEKLMLRYSFKNSIEKLINSLDLDNATKYIEEYKDLFGMDESYYNIKAILYIINEDIENGMVSLKNSYFLNSKNEDTICNIIDLKSFAYKEDEISKLNRILEFNR